MSFVDAVFVLCVLGLGVATLCGALDPLCVGGAMLCIIASCQLVKVMDTNK